MSNIDIYFTEKEIEAAREIVDGMKKGMANFSLATIERGDDFPESALLPSGSTLFTNRFGHDSCSIIGTTVTPAEAIQWATELGVNIRDPFNRLIQDPNKIVEKVDQWVESENFRLRYGKPGTDNNKDLLVRAREGHAWEKETGETLDLENYLSAKLAKQQEKAAESQEEDRSAAPTESSLHNVSSFCPAGMILTGVTYRDQLQVPGCGAVEPPSPMTESDLPCSVNGINGVIVFHDGREECPQGMKPLPDNGPRRGNSR